MSPAPRDRGVLVGTMGLEDDARVDFARLRADRREKVLAGMERHGLDALMLGGVGNVRYVSGARQLGRAGVLPFAPVAVVVAETARVHLLSTWDEGVPPEIGYEDLYRMNWNPANLAADLAKIPGVREARRVGTDGLTPRFAGLIRQLVTTAELVDAAAGADHCATGQDARGDHLPGRRVGHRGSRTDRDGGRVGAGDHRA